MGLLFVKFNDERKREYCIKTVIEKKGDAVKIYKEAIFDEGLDNIKRIVNNKNVLEEHFDYECCPVKLVDKQAVFDLIEGKTLTDLYCEALKKGDISDFERLLLLHKKHIIGKEGNIVSFHNNESCENVFGNSEEYNGKDALICCNYDLIPENLFFKDDKAVAIDYEWVFDFPVPLDYVIYHCIKEFYDRNQFVEKIYPLKKALELLAVEETDRLKETENCFYHFVSSDGKEEGFCVMKAICLKNTKTYSDIMKERDEAVVNKDNALFERDNAITEMNKAVLDRANALAEKQMAIDNYNGLEKIYNDLLSKYRKTIRGLLGRARRKLKRQ